MAVILTFIGAIPVFVEFTSDLNDSWKTGAIVDLKDELARSIISIGQAKESSAGDAIRASNRADMDKFKADLLGEIRTAIKPQPTKGPPSGGGGVNFEKISNGTPAEEHEKGLFTDALRCIAIVQCVGGGFDPTLVDYCRRRLRNVYADEVTEYQVDEKTGKLNHTVTRSMADGGMETITRTGTDSLSGGASYGFTLKPDYLGGLFRIATEQEVFAGPARKLPPPSGNELKWPALDQYKAPTTVNGIPQAAVFAGITFAYKGETRQRVGSDAATNMITFKIEDLTAFTDFSRDYIIDNYIAMDSVVTELFGMGAGWVEDYVCIRGDGVAKPQGYFNANATITSGPNTGARSNANKISADDLMYMMSRISPMCWPGLRWIANVTTIPQLGILRDSSNAAIFQPNALVAQYERLSIMADSTVDRNRLLSRPMGMLIGLPIYFSEKVPVLGTTGDISLVDPTQYGLVRKGGLEVGISEHFYFDTDRIAYRVKLRHDGRALWRAPYQQADGSNTQVTPFFVLK